MAGVNKVILVGNLGADPESRSFANGGEVVNLRIATSETWKDRDGNRQEKTEWHTVAIFNENLGRVAKSYLKKGSKVYLEGQLQTRKWQDQSGNDRYSTEVVLQKFRGELVHARRRAKAAAAAAATSAVAGRDYGVGRRRWRRLRRRRLQAPVAPATRGVRHRPRRRRSLLRPSLRGGRAMPRAPIPARSAIAARSRTRKSATARRKPGSGMKCSDAVTTGS